MKKTKKTRVDSALNSLSEEEKRESDRVKL